MKKKSLRLSNQKKRWLKRASVASGGVMTQKKYRAYEIARKHLQDLGISLPKSTYLTDLFKSVKINNNPIAIKDWIADHFGIVLDTKLITNAQPDKAMGWYVPANDTITLTVNANSECLIHEMGHAVEHYSDMLRQQAYEYLACRYNISESVSCSKSSVSFLHDATTYYASVYHDTCETELTSEALTLLVSEEKFVGSFWNQPILFQYMLVLIQ